MNFFINLSLKKYFPVKTRILLHIHSIGVYRVFSLIFFIQEYTYQAIDKLVFFNLPFLYTQNWFSNISFIHFKTTRLKNNKYKQKFHSWILSTYFNIFAKLCFMENTILMYSLYLNFLKIFS